MCCIGGLEARLETVSLSLTAEQCLSVDALYLHACQDICTNLHPEKKALCAAENRIIIKMKNNCLIKLTDKTYFHVYPVRCDTTAPNTGWSAAGKVTAPNTAGVRGKSDSSRHGLGPGESDSPRHGLAPGVPVALGGVILADGIREQPGRC